LSNGDGVTAPETISEAIWTAAAASGLDRPALIFGDRTWSYRELRELAYGTAQGLQDLGVGTGDTVAVFMRNCAEAVGCLLGAGELGAIHVPINANYRGEFLRHQLGDSGARVVVCDASLLPRLIEVLSEVPTVTDIVVRGAPDEARARGSRVTTTDEALAPRSVAPTAAAPTRQGDPAFIAYTGGTTGPSKGAVLSHAYLLRAAREHWQYRRGTPEDITYTPLPLFHVNAIVNAVLGPLLHGATGVIDEQFSVRGFWARAREVRATTISVMGAMVTLLWQRDPSPEDRDHDVRVLFGGPIPKDIHVAFEERFGLEICLVYGMSEATPISIAGPGVGVPGSAGVVRDSYELRIIDEDDADVSPGDVGQVILRPSVPHALFSGYWKRPQATVDAQHDLWFLTGDLARVDEHGNLFFVDRKKDVIRRRGETVSSYEVEQVAARHPVIAEVAAVGVPSALTEEDVMLFVVRADGSSLDATDVWKHCELALPYFAVPRYIDFVAELPKSQLGKVLKTELRAQGVRASTWDAEAEGYVPKR
jgi:crotonobetaine/carnitine-CoA ligase